MSQFDQFLDHLHRGGAVAHWWHGDKKASVWFDVGGRRPWPRHWDNANVLFSIHPCTSIPEGEKPEQYRKSRIGYIAAVNCFFAEFDAKDFGDKEAIKDHLWTLPLYPSMAIDSGGGFHCYWLLSETVPVTDDNRDHVKNTQYAWVDLVKGDDNSKDLARVLRVPGTQNQKPEYAPSFPTVTIIECDMDRTYTLAQFEALTSEKRKAYSKRHNNTPTAPATAKDVATAKDCLNRLAAWRADDYGDWVRVGMALKWLGDDGLQLWEQWSEQSPKYVDGCCDAKWDTFKMDGVTLGTLVHMADEDTPRNGRHHDGFSNGVTNIIDPETGEIMEGAPAEDGASASQHNGVYFVSKGRIGTFRTDKEGNEDFHPLCNFNAWIAADISVDDGEHISRQVAIAGKLPNGATLKEIEIPADEFESMKWVIANWGAKVWIAPERGAKDRLRHAIQVLSADTMQERTSRAHTGWAIIDGKRVFLHAAGALGMDGVSVKLPSQLDGYRFPTDGAVDPVTAMKESIALLKVAPMKVSAPMWASMFAAPLTEINTPAFTVSVEGGSGSYKSSYSAVMLNHFGAGFTDKRMPADWLGTANSLEKLCFHAKDIPLVIDDFRPTTSITEGKALMEAVNRITRAAGNRQGRSRLDAGSDFKRSYAPRGLVMMTAERKALGKSTASRILTVDVAPGDIDTNLLTEAQKRRHVYSYAMAGFIQWVGNNWEALSKSLPDFMMDTRSQGANLGYHKRLPEATAVLYTAFCCAMRYAVEIGAICQDEAEHLKGECYSVLQDIMEAQNASTDNEDPAIKYLEILANLVAQNKAYIGAKGQNGLLLGIADGAEKLGWNDGHTLYLLPGAYNLVNRYARSEGWAFPSDESTLRKELHRAGCIVERDGDKLTKKVREPGAGKMATPINVTAVSLARFAEILIPMLNDDDTIKALERIKGGVPGL